MQIEYLENIGIFLMKESLKLSLFTYPVLCTAAVIFYIFMAHIPYCWDDWNFKEIYMRTSGDVFSLSFNHFLDYIQIVRAENDGRLSNIVVILFEFLPRHVYDVFFALSTVAWLAYSSILTRSDRKCYAPTVILIWLIYIIFLPWRDLIMSCVDFSLNYVVASAVTITFLGLYFLCKKSRQLWLLLPLAFITGCWHEGFSVPLAAGIFGYSIYKRKLDNPWRFAVFLTLVAGIILAMSSSGLRNRINENHFVSNNFTISYVMRDMLPVLCVTIWLLIMSLRPNRRKRLKEIADTSLLVLWLGAMATAVVIVVHAGESSRVSWSANMFAILAIVTLINSYRRLDTLIKHTSLIGYMVIIAFYCGVIHWQIKTEKDHYIILNQFKNSPDGNIDYDVELWSPIYTLHHPCRYQLFEPFSKDFFKGVPTERVKRIVTDA